MIMEVIIRKLIKLHYFWPHFCHRHLYKGRLLRSLCAYGRVCVSPLSMTTTTKGDLGSGFSIFQSPSGWRHYFGVWIEAADHGMEWIPKQTVHLMAGS